PELPGFERVVTATTRAPRKDDIQGTHYRFLSAEEFDKRLRENGFLEWAVVHGNRYGTPREVVEKKLAAGTSLLLAVDVQGAKSIREKMREAVTVFITPPSLKELEIRLRGRSTEPEADIERRVAAAQEELKQIDRYDFAVVNADLDKAADELLRIVRTVRSLDAGGKI
ncbi:MAG: guanylate kinase, partial [Actinomycetota bacterium]